LPELSHWVVPAVHRSLQLGVHWPFLHSPAPQLEERVQSEQLPPLEEVQTSRLLEESQRVAPGVQSLLQVDTHCPALQTFPLGQAETAHP
jgi:hypothetical protein